MFNPGDDKELDQLSREAADHFEAPDNASWSSLEKKLDEVMPIDSKRRKAFLWWLLPCLFLGGGMLFYLLDKNNQQPANQYITPVIQSHPPESKIFRPDSAFIQLSVKPATKIDQIITLKPVIKNTSIPVNELPATVLPPGDYNTKETAAEKKQALQYGSTSQSLTDTSGTAMMVKPSPDLQKTGSPADTTSSADSSSNSKAGKPANIKRSRFSIGLLAGADLSNVKFTYSSAPGYNIGLMAGYDLGKKWSLHTGAVYTWKNYKMKGSDFTAPKGSPPSYWSLQTVAGSCSMWEIPLLVRYGLGQKVNRRFFLSTGISSYFMKEENYDYYYPSPVTGLLVSRSGYYNAGNTHWFSIVHFSAGFEQSLGGNLSMIFEPYLKLPLAGLGVGSIKLSSLGLNVTLQYRGARVGR